MFLFPSPDSSLLPNLLILLSLLPSAFFSVSLSLTHLILILPLALRFTLVHSGYLGLPKDFKSHSFSWTFQTDCCFCWKCFWQTVFLKNQDPIFCHSSLSFLSLSSSLLLLLLLLLFL